VIYSYQEVSNEPTCIRRKENEKKECCTGVAFVTPMWKYCGHEVKNGYLVEDDWEVMSEWTEEIEE